MALRAEILLLAGVVSSATSRASVADMVAHPTAVVVVEVLALAVQLTWPGATLLMELAITPAERLRERAAGLVGLVGKLARLQLETLPEEAALARLIPKVTAQPERTGE